MEGKRGVLSLLLLAQSTCRSWVLRKGTERKEPWLPRLLLPHSVLEQLSVAARRGDRRAGDKAILDCGLYKVIPQHTTRQREKRKVRLQETKPKQGLCCSNRDLIVPYYK